MKRYVHLLIVIVVICVASQAQALIVNPDPTRLYNDDKSQLFYHCDCAAAVEYKDILDSNNLGGSIFGFFFWGDDLSNPDNLVTIFDTNDTIIGTDKPNAKIDFINGRVGDMDGPTPTLQDTFIPHSNDIPIGFFLQFGNQLIYPQPIFTVASLNLGDEDLAATFPVIGDPDRYLIGFEVFDPNINNYRTLAFELVNGITPATLSVSEPATLSLVGLGLLMVGLFSIRSLIFKKGRATN